MKALPMMQPWASLVVHGIKSTETRDRHTSHRGPLLILATKTVVPYEEAHAAWDHLIDLLELDAALDVPRGKVIGGVVVADSVCSKVCVDDPDVEGWQKRSSTAVLVQPSERLLGDYGPGRRIWLMGAAVRFEQPIICRGMPGMFDVPAAVADEALLQWPAFDSWARRWA